MRSLHSSDDEAEVHEQFADARREHEERATARSRSLAAFYAAGGLLNVVSSAVPGWHPQARGGLLLIAGIALTTALFLHALASRTTALVCHVLLVIGSLLIAGCMVSAGPSPMAITYAFFFCWVSVYAANWMTLRALTGHLLVAALCEAAAIAAVARDGLVLPACVVSMGACTAAGLVVHRLRAQVQQLAVRDPLTGALNRRGLTELMFVSQRRGPVWTVVALDLDGFKPFNDERGHGAGDDALRTCVRSWSGLLGPGEACARVGGDEFVLLCRRPPEQIADLVRRARACAPKPLSVSAGTATAVAGESAVDLFARADAALYRDKNIPKARSGRRREAILPDALVPHRVPVV